jgi:hypothetical protein
MNIRCGEQRFEKLARAKIITLSCVDQTVSMVREIFIGFVFMKISVFENSVTRSAEVSCQSSAVEKVIS